MTVATEIKMTLSNNCMCEPTEDSEFDILCGGECWESAIEDLDALVEEWLQRNPSEHGYHATGTNMGWRHQTGEAHWNPDRKAIYEVIAPVRADWTQEYTFHADTIEVTQYHHDAPTGEFYTVRVATAAEEDSLSA